MRINPALIIFRPDLFASNETYYGWLVLIVVMQTRLAVVNVDGAYLFNVDIAAVMMLLVSTRLT